jgi:hypothetical protein
MDVLGTTPPVERAAQLEPTRSLPVRRVDATHSLSVTVGEAVLWYPHLPSLLQHEPSKHGWPGPHWIGPSTRFRKAMLCEEMCFFVCRECLGLIDAVFLVKVPLVVMWEPICPRMYCLLNSMMSIAPTGFRWVSRPYVVNDGSMSAAVMGLHTRNMSAEFHRGIGLRTTPGRLYCC